jgi:two-component system chemotaxis response regulator CheY
MNKPSCALIVDDNVDNREVFRIILQAYGYTTVEAEDGQYALDILETRCFDLVLLDLQMPRVNGVTVLQHIRNEPRLAEMEVMIVTANSQIAAIAEALANYVLYKPVDPVQLGTLAQRIHSARERANIRTSIISEAV